MATIGWRITRDIAAATAAAGSSVGAGWATWKFLNSQAREARAVIPHRTDNAPDGDGVYSPDGSGPTRVESRQPADIHMMIFGDSTAAGLGADTALETPGVQLARMVAIETHRSVRLSTKAIVGATSLGLSGQVNAMLIAGPAPDVSVILIGANDITAAHRPAPAAKRVGDAVARLIDVGSVVVVGTCPDLGVVAAIPQPLRSVLRQWGFRLAKAQSQRVRSAGGRPVPLADLLAPEFKAAPEKMLSSDHYHPSAAGYALAARTLLPEVLAALGEWGARPLPVPPEVSSAAEHARIVARIARALGHPLRPRTRLDEPSLREDPGRSAMA